MAEVGLVGDDAGLLEAPADARQRTGFGDPHPGDRQAGEIAPAVDLDGQAGLAGEPAYLGDADVEKGPKPVVLDQKGLARLQAAEQADDGAAVVDARGRLEDEPALERGHGRRDVRHGAQNPRILWRRLGVGVGPVIGSEISTVWMSSRCTPKAV